MSNTAALRQEKNGMLYYYMSGAHAVIAAKVKNKHYPTMGATDVLAPKPPLATIIRQAPCPFVLRPVVV